MSPHVLRRTTPRPADVMRPATSSKRCGWRGTTTSRGFGDAAAWRAHAASSIASSPSRVTAASTTGRPRASRQAAPRASSAASGDMSNFRLPLTCTCGAPTSRRRAASASVCASTSAKCSTAGRITARSRSPLRRLFSLRRALASTMGTPCRSAACSRFGQISVSISTPTRGRNWRKKRFTTPGVSYGSQACWSPSRSSALPAARPVAVPWVSSIRMPGRALRKASISAAAARVSPSDTACTHTQPSDGAPR